MKYFIHPNALCETKNIGMDTKISAYTHILPMAQIGNECEINDFVLIENDVFIGNGVIIKSGAKILDGTVIHDKVFIGSNVTFDNEPQPSASKKIFISEGVSIGANSTIGTGITIGAKAVVAAGTVITQNVPSNAIVSGNPARISGYVNATSRSFYEFPTQSSVNKTSAVKGVSLHKLKEVSDIRGRLSVGEFERELPFKPNRFFLIYDVPSEQSRGEHAHIKCHQFLLAVRGRLNVVVDDGKNREEFTLDNACSGLYLPPMTWAIQYRFSQDCLLLVFASDHYDEEDYVRNYDEFKLKIKNEKRG